MDTITHIMLSIKYHISLSTYALLENYFVNLLGRQSGKIKFLENYLSRARILSILPLHEYKFRQKAKLVLENYFLKLGIRRKQNVHECKFSQEAKWQNYIWKITWNPTSSANIFYQLANVLRECKFTQKAKLLIKIWNNEHEYFLRFNQCTAQ